MTLRLTLQDEIAVLGVPSWSGRRRISLVPRVRSESDAGASGTPQCCYEHGEQSREQKAPPDHGAPHDGGDTMERVIERCAGLDMHKKTVAAGVRVPAPGGRGCARSPESWSGWTRSRGLAGGSPRA